MAEGLFEAPTEYEPPAAPVIEPRDIAPKETVKGQVKDIISEGSPLLTMEQTRAKEEANRRGLLNTSMAVQAGEAATISKALDIAQPDAATHAQAGLSAQQARQQADLTGYQGEISSAVSEKDTAQKGSIESKLSAQEADQQMALSQFTADHQVQLQREELDAKIAMNMADKASEDRASYSEAANQIWQQYQVQYAEIITTADSILTAESKKNAIGNLNNMVQKQVDFLSALYDVDITWESSGIGVGGPEAFEASPQSSAPVTIPSPPSSTGSGDGTGIVLGSGADGGTGSNAPGTGTGDGTGGGYGMNAGGGGGTTSGPGAGSTGPYGNPVSIHPDYNGVAKLVTAANGVDTLFEYDFGNGKIHSERYFRSEAEYIQYREWLMATSIRDMVDAGSSGTASSRAEAARMKEAEKEKFKTIRTMFAMTGGANVSKYPWTDASNVTSNVGWNGSSPR